MNIEDIATGSTRKKPTLNQSSIVLFKLLDFRRGEHYEGADNGN